MCCCTRSSWLFHAFFKSLNCANIHNRGHIGKEKWLIAIEVVIRSIFSFSEPISRSVATRPPSLVSACQRVCMHSQGENVIFDLIANFMYGKLSICASHMHSFAVLTVIVSRIAVDDGPLLAKTLCPADWSWIEFLANISHTRFSFHLQTSSLPQHVFENASPAPLLPVNATPVVYPTLYNGPPKLSDSYLPAVMQALAYYVELIQYEPLYTTTIEPPFTLPLDNNIYADQTTTTRLSWTPTTTTSPIPSTTQPPTTTSSWWDSEPTTQFHKPGYYSPDQPPRGATTQQEASRPISNRPTNRPPQYQRPAQIGDLPLLSVSNDPYFDFFLHGQKLSNAPKTLTKKIGKLRAWCCHVLSLIHIPPNDTFHFFLFLLIFIIAFTAQTINFCINYRPICCKTSKMNRTNCPHNLTSTMWTHSERFTMISSNAFATLHWLDRKRAKSAFRPHGHTCCSSWPTIC